MRADFRSNTIDRTDNGPANASARVVALPAEGVYHIVGPPGSGKTWALASRAGALAARGSVLVVCSHESGARAFREALAAQRISGDVRVGTAPAHLLGLLRSHYALAGVRPDVRAGGELAARAVVRDAAAGLLDLSWPELRDGEMDLGLPFLSRPEWFLEEAAGLMRQLRGARVSAEEFERGCAAGLTAFYGDEVEAALAKCRDPNVHARASRRGREALGTGPAVLQAQRRAERDLGTLLARLYREYLRAARLAPLLSDEDIVDECVRWLKEDSRSARAVAHAWGAVIVDDAEDAQPALADFLVLLIAAGLPGVTLAGWHDAAIDGLQGRRSLLAVMEPAQRVLLAPPGEVPGRNAARLATEAEEIDSLAHALGDLLRSGAAPDEIVLLTRSVDAAAAYARALESRGLPTASPADGFAAPLDVADWLALTAVVTDAYDHEHLLRVLASPLLGLSDASIWAMCEDPAAVTQLALDVGVNDERRGAGKGRQRTALARNMLEGTADDRLPEATRDLVVRFRERLREWRERFALFPPPHVLARLARAAGFEASWESAPAHRRARLLDDALRVVEAFAADRARGAQRTLHELVRAFEDGLLPLRPAAPVRGAIACEAVSSAKGLHWRHVFVAGLAHERFPRIYIPRALAFSRTYGLIARENVAPGAAQTAKFAWYYARFDAKSLYLAEERRALNYALSRGVASSSATGYGKPPRWAKDYDLLATLGVM